MELQRIALAIALRLALRCAECWVVEVFITFPGSFILHIADGGQVVCPTSITLRCSTDSEISFSSLHFCSSYCEFPCILNKVKI